MSKQLTDWDLALIRAGFVDPRNEEKPSYNQLAQAVGVPQSTVSAIVSGRSRKPKPENVQKIADALRLDVRVVAGWVGQERTERTRYTPPAEADLLTDRQRRAVDEIIRAIAAERVSSRDEPAPDPAAAEPAPVGDDLADSAQQDGATSSDASRAARERRARWVKVRDAVHGIDNAAPVVVEGLEDLPQPSVGEQPDDVAAEDLEARPWEQDEYRLAAKRGRNRGREARQQQDHDAEDDGA